MMKSKGSNYGPKQHQMSLEVDLTEIFIETYCCLDGSMPGCWWELFGIYGLVDSGCLAVSMWSLHYCACFMKRLSLLCLISNLS